MLRWLRGLYRWHRMAEGKDLPSDPMSLPHFITISHDAYRILDRLNTAGFCFVVEQKSRLL